MKSDIHIGSVSYLWAILRSTIQPEIHGYLAMRQIAMYTWLFSQKYMAMQLHNYIATYHWLCICSPYCQCESYSPELEWLYGPNNIAKNVWLHSHVLTNYIAMNVWLYCYTYVHGIPHICHRRHRRCRCKFFLSSINFPRMNAKLILFFVII